MKLRLMAIGLILSAGIAAPAFADEGEQHPCKAIRQACLAAGFVKGKEAPAGKHLFKNCIRPLVHGEAVAGVNVPASEIQACKEKHKERMEKWRERHQESSK